VPFLFATHLAVSMEHEGANGPWADFIRELAEVGGCEGGALEAALLRASGKYRQHVVEVFAVHLDETHESHPAWSNSNLESGLIDGIAETIATRSVCDP